MPENLFKPNGKKINSSIIIYRSSDDYKFVRLKFNRNEKFEKALSLKVNFVSINLKSTYTQIISFVGLK